MLFGRNVSKQRVRDVFDLPYLDENIVPLTVWLLGATLNFQIVREFLDGCIDMVG